MENNLIKLKTGSDFSGVGAFDQALKKIGISHETVFACDMDKYARQTYIENYGEPKYYPENVYDREIPKEPLDLYMTSPPCQAFSLAGRRKGEDDTRGILFYNSHEFISYNKPRYFIFENVKGLMSDANGRTFQIWCDMLGGKSVNGNPVLFPREDATPYHIYHQVLNAKHYGVPQNRERVFIVGIRDDSDNNFSFPKKQPLKIKLKDILETEVLTKRFLSEKAIIKCTKSQKNRNILINEVPDVSSCLVAGYYKIPFDGQYIKVESNLDKYYLNNNTIDNLLKYNQRQVENNRGFAAKFRDINVVETMDALKVGGGGKDDLIKITSATKKGFELANLGDSISLQQPSSETRRGRVGKGVAQTLDTKCGQAVFVGKEVRTEESKQERKTTGSNSFRGKKLEFREQETMNTIGTALTNDNILVEGGKWNDFKDNNGDKKGFQGIRDGCSPSLLARARNDGSGMAAVKIDAKIRRLTPRECFRLMDFPDTFKLVCSDTQNYKQAGNSIVVNVLAEILKKLL